MRLADEVLDMIESEKRKCTVCGKQFTPSYGEYARCPSCLGKQHSAAEKEIARR